MDTRNRWIKTDTYSKEQIERVLSDSGIDIESEVDSHYIIFCPFHFNNRTPAGEVDKVSGRFFCFSCHHTVDIIELVMHISGKTYFESIRFIKNKQIPNNFEKDINKKLITKTEFIEFDNSVIKKLNNNLISSKRANEYLSHRKINDYSKNKFTIGYSEKQDMITIPVHSPDGILVGFVGRSIDGKEFKNTPKLPKSKTLFNLHRVKSSSKIYVVESSFDVIRLDQCGLPAVATLGANVSNTQIDLLKKYFYDIIIIADNDEAGGNMKQKIIEQIGSRVSVINLDKKYKDVGDMDNDQIKKIDLKFENSIAYMLQ